MKKMQSMRLLLLAFLFTPMLAVAAAKDEVVWDNVLKKEFFAGKNLQEGNDVITVKAPYRAEDPALVPITISSKISQTESRFIKRIVVFVDKNPFPFVADFEFTPASGKADISMRVRVNSYSYVRAIAETNDGEFYMSKTFVKASGGCSAPIGADLDAAMKRLGKMKFRLDNGAKAGQPSMAQLLISHPNITGMQMDQVTRFIKKSHFVKELKVTFNGEKVLTAKTDIAISADPNFRFYFVPKKSGVLKAEITDTSCEKPDSRAVCTEGQSYSQSHQVDL